MESLDSALQAASLALPLTIGTLSVCRGALSPNDHQPHAKDPQLFD
jgi:hypothetical protein